jgi:hypothetical protein
MKAFSTKVIAISSTTLLSVLLGIAVPAFAVQDRQEEKQNGSKPQECSHQQAKPRDQQSSLAQSQPQKRVDAAI